MAVDPASTFPSRSKPCYLIITLTSYEIMKALYRLVTFSLLLVSFTYVSSFVTDKHPSSSITHYEQSVVSASDSVNLDQLISVFFRDLTNEGLMKREYQKSVFLTNAVEQNLITGARGLADYNIDLIALSDLEKQSSVLDRTVDFIFTFNFQEASRFIDRTLKTGGVVTVLLNDSPSAAFYKPANYEIAYMRRFDLIAVAMWKTSITQTKSENHRKLLSGHASEAKKAALLKLEDVLLEPPRSASKKSSRYLKRTRYLPDLMGDSLESYPRRVFIEVGSPEKDEGSKSDWFSRNYPTRNKDFEMYKIETVTGESSGKEVPQIGMSDWLRRNVKEEEYVVMKAEAEAVEEMVRSKTIRLVDELFLECKPELGKKDESKSRRAYWECLALYGKLRDEGVAVHQWWG
ncbi:uncharacterized protein LOC114734314 [Neltuma alba]|uniref:uncharacterized protein LOC114734314 n=1 Tax=Neltuma alba TaxID=207710 RepID=UPI0010A2BD4D|nr:uncharacterized protein LOC114734314 [Prosopis alba]XP_028777762.1 uncharacterized protein LOC114734314 [Prosopis alba]